MRHLALLTVLLVPVPQEERPTDDRALLRGTWKVELYLDGGEVQDNRDQTVVIAGNTLTQKRGARVEGTWTITLDPGKRPKWLDLDNRGVRWLGIYELAGDDLKICFNERPNGERSTAFESRLNSPNDVLFILKRQKR